MAYKNKEKQREYQRKWCERKRRELGIPERAIGHDPLPVHKLRVEEAREYVWSLKDQPCTDCGGRFHPVQMDFDHLPGQPKKYAISRLVRGGYTKEQIDDEVAKCELVCSNCHRYRTWKRLQ